MHFNIIKIISAFCVFSIVFTGLYGCTSGNAQKSHTDGAISEKDRGIYKGADQKAVDLYNSFEQRQIDGLQLYYRKPSVPLGEGRDDQYWAYPAYALTALTLNLDVANANTLVKRLTSEYKPPVKKNKTDTLPQFKSYFGMAMIQRMYYMFSDKGSVAPERLTSDAQKGIEEYFFTYVSNWSETEKANQIFDNEIWIEGSENHDIVRRANFLLGAQMLKDHPDYKDELCYDGKTLSEHYEAWLNYMKFYYRTKLSKGFMTENASPGYAKYTIDCTYAIYDFIKDEELKMLARSFLDLYYSDLILEMSNGGRGGAKSRAYKLKGAVIAANDCAVMYAYAMFGKQEELVGNRSFHPACLSALISTYKAPFVLFDIAVNAAQKGPYEFVSYPLGAGKREVVNGELVYKVEFPTKTRKYTYVTPSYVMGVSTIDEKGKYIEIHTQNKWMGVLFSGAVRNNNFDSRIVLLGDGTDQEGDRGLNEINGVGAKGAMMASFMKDAVKSKGLKLFISDDMFSTIVYKDGWAFVEDPDGSSYAAFKPSKGKFNNPVEYKTAYGYYFTFTEKYAPVVVQCAEKSEYKSFDAFINDVLDNTFEWKSDSEFLYKSLKGDTLTWFTDKSIPKVNGVEVELVSDIMYKSPYMNANVDDECIVIKDTKGKKYEINQGTVL